MPKMQLGLSVLCGRDNTMNHAARLHISPQAPGGDPVDIDIPIEGGKDGDTPDEIVAKVIAAVKEAGGTATAKSATIDTGAKTTASGKKSPTTTVLCLITIDGLESMDVASDRDKLQVYFVTGDTGPLPPPPPPGPTTPSGGERAGADDTSGETPDSGSGGTTGGGLTPHKGRKWETPTESDCTKYREEYEREKEKRERRGRARKKEPKDPPVPPKPQDWFCDPRTDWQTLAQLGGMPPIGNMLVGAVDVSDFDWSIMRSSLVNAGWLLIPFRVVRASIALQLFEMRMRLAAAGVVTRARGDGVIEPTRFLVGPLTGEPVRSFGFATPFDPLGYTTFPWRMVLGSSTAVARHVEPRTHHGTSHPMLAPLGRTAEPVGVDVVRSPVIQSMPTVGPSPYIAPQHELWSEWARMRAAKPQIENLFDDGVADT